VVYLDSAATTQKPRTVIDAVTASLADRTANPGRGSYPWSARGARRIAEVRAQAARFLGAASAEEIVFTPGATAGLNAVALSWGLANLADGDEVLYSPLDHTSNVYPWVHLREVLAGFGRRITLVPYRVTAAGEADTADIAAKVTPRTRLITVAHVHHVFGARYLPHWQSVQAQFAQVQLGLSQLRAVSPQAQFTQLHGSQVHAGFSHVVAVLMGGSSLAGSLPTR
jgi:cysteine desulfurase / selenocysteine lyase